MSLVDDELALLVVTGRFRLPRPGYPAEPALDERPPCVPFEDTHHGEPGRSSLRWEGQSCCERPGTDIYLSGHAWAPAGTRVTETPVGLEVGPCRQTAVVLGDRAWRRSITGLAPSAPAAFERIPLTYERCFGGVIDGARGATALAVDRNPVGMGLLAVSGAPLPNIEDPAARITSPRDRPRPRGFGPVARHWLPRRALSGTYDATWVETRAPLWPADVDPRFFLAASAALQATPRLVGGEAVTIIGMHPDGALRSVLPARRLIAKFELEGRDHRTRLSLDAVMLEPDELALTMVWRAAAIVTPNMFALTRVIVRELESWEGEG